MLLQLRPASTGPSAGELGAVGVTMFAGSEPKVF